MKQRAQTKRLTARERRFREPRFATLSRDLARADVPASVVIVECDGADLTDECEVERIVREMLAVPLDKSILLSFLIGYDPRSRTKRALSEDEQELYRLQMLLNSRFHGQRFDWLGQGMVSKLIRESIRAEAWNPFRDRKTEA